jgi:hypothetical protein
MSYVNSPSGRNQVADVPSDVRRRIDAAAWGAFIVWIGSSMLASIKWGCFLVGIGAIILAAQTALRAAGEKVEGPWLICGAVFVAAGLWEILSLRWPLAPLLIIAFGIAMLWQAFFARSQTKL